jgi:hypothetical protein
MGAGAADAVVVGDAMADDALAAASGVMAGWAGMFTPLMSVILAETEVMPPLPFCAEKDSAAIFPLPENGVVRMMAILMVPGTVVLAIDRAPSMSPPQLTEGDVRADVSYPMVSSMPDTPFMLSPRTENDPSPEGVTVTEAPKASEALQILSAKASRMCLKWCPMSLPFIA